MDMWDLWEIATGDRECGGGGGIFLPYPRIAPMDRSSGSSTARGKGTNEKEGADGAGMGGWGAVHGGNGWKEQWKEEGEKPMVPGILTDFGKEGGG